MSTVWQKNWQNEPNIHKIEEQKRWEIEATERASVKYLSSLKREVNHKDGTTSHVDRAFNEVGIADRAIHDIIGEKGGDGLLGAMERMQVLFLKRLSEGRRASKYIYPLLEFTPIELAVIATRVAFNIEPHQLYEGVGRTSLGLRMGQAVKTELEFRDWKRSSRLAAKESKEEKDHAAWMIHFNKGTVNAKTFARWKRKREEIHPLDWERPFCVSVGMPMVVLLTDHSRGWFLKSKRWQGNVSSIRIQLSEEAQACIKDMILKEAYAKPYKLPMKCPPVPWERTH